MKSAQQFAQHKTGSGVSSNLQNAVANFFHAFDYKGEHCFACGHPWTEKGELHYKSCRYYVPNHLHSPKKH